MSSTTFGGGGAGGTGGGGTGGPPGRGEPPNLALLSGDPQYDLATVVQLVGVRPMTLWAWEQHLGIPRPERVGDGTGGTVRHYSERDLAACTWLRDQILAGASPAEAAEQLLAAQPSGMGADPAARPAGSAPAAGPPSLGPSPYRRASGPPRPLGAGEPSGPLDTGVRRAVPSGPSRAQEGSGPTGGPQRGPVSMGPASGVQRGQAPVGTTSGPLGRGRWQGPPSGAGRELRSLVPQLIRAFVAFDTPVANRLVDEALAVRSFETVCVGLLLPALNRIGEMWARRELTIPEERFALTFVRGRLFAVFAATQERYEWPLAVVACGPRETDDVRALMLAAFWRRAGVRVAFLGQDVDGQALVHDVQGRRPRLVCVAITSTQRLRALARIAREVAHLPAPAPIFSYSGAVFARNPELQRRVEGVYLGDDPASATWQVVRLLGLDQPMAPRMGPPHGPIGEVG